MLINDKNEVTLSDGTQDKVDRIQHIPVTPDEYEQYVFSSKAQSPVRTEMEIGHLARLSVEKADRYLHGHREYESYKGPEKQKIGPSISLTHLGMLGMIIAGLVIVGVVQFSK